MGIKKAGLSGIVLAILGFVTINIFPEFGMGAIIAALVILTVSIISSYVADPN